MELDNFYKHIKMYLNTVTRLLEDILPTYKCIKWNYDFHEKFASDISSPSYSWNENTHTYLGHLVLMDLKNDTYIKSSMEHTRLSPPTLIKYKDGLFYPYFSMYYPLILEAWMVMYSLNLPPWNSSKDNNLSIFIE